MVVEDIKQAIEDLDYAKQSVKTCLDDESVLVDMHNIVYWATKVNDLRRQIKEQL